MDLRSVILFMVVSCVLFGGISCLFGVLFNTLVFLGLKKAFTELVAARIMVCIGGPFIEELMKLLMVCIAFNVCKKRTSNQVETKHYYYLQMASICIGGGFAMFENFLYVGFCHSDITRAQG
eukprot:71342_1